MRPTVAVARAEDVLAVLDPELLTPAERRRGAALRDPRDRAAHAAAHLLVRVCAGEVAGRPPAEIAVEQWCGDCGRPGHGRPQVRGRPSVHLSLGHVRGVVVAAADTAPIGVDLEPPRAPDLLEPAARLALGPAERRLVRRADDPSAAFLRLWVGKESLVKAGALSLDAMAGADLSDLLAGSPDGCAEQSWRGRRVAVRGDRELGVTLGVAGRPGVVVRPLHGDRLAGVPDHAA